MRELIRARWEEVDALLDTLLELPAEQREAELEFCCDDAQLRAAVRQLLSLDGRSHVALDQLERTLAGRDAAADSAVTQGQYIGPYRIERALGEGGMGAVFLAARQTAEFTQHVALKLLRVSLFSAAQQEQFRREQQIHARLQHPHIARIYDSGISAAGVPYFAMEFVDGTPVTEYCDSHRLGIDARLKLFATICEAVAYAHQNLIVHRDLKPSNILVGDDGEPKLLDFGIAKLLSGAGEDQRTHTEQRQLTPNYAAPEQFDGGAITTATDVYALGVLLCELLTGARPPPANADSAPLRASSQTTDPAAAVRRDSNPSALKRRLRGDLESIVAKALHSEPQRRYPGAAALREDIIRHLDGRPIQARPDATMYRFGKFIQRHKVGFAASLALAATLVGATVFSVQQARIARHEAVRATAEAERANAVRTFLQELFNSAAPGISTAESADELLMRGRERVEHDFDNNPDLHAEILGLLGDLQRRRGHSDRAREPLQQSADLARKLFGSSDARTLHAEYLLALQSDDAGLYREGAAQLQKAVDAFHPADLKGSEAQVLALGELGILYQRAGDDARAIALDQEALDMARRIFPSGHTMIDTAMANLGDVYKEAGRYAEAVPLLTQVLESARRRLGTQHADVAVAMAQLASAKHKLGSYAEAERLLRDAVAIDAQAYSQPNHIASSHLNNLGVELVSVGKFDEAIDEIQQSIAMDRRIYPGGHPQTADALGNVAMILFREGLYAQAEVSMRACIAEETRVRGDDYPDNGYDQNSLARILIPEGKLDEAQTLLDQALADSRKRHGDKHVYAASALHGQALLSAARGDHAQAVTRAREALAMYEQLLPANHNKTTGTRLVLGENLYALGNYVEAKAIFSTALAHARSAKPPIPVLVAHALADLELADAALGQTDDANEARRQAEAALMQIPPGRNAERDEVQRLLARAAQASTTRPVR